MEPSRIIAPPWARQRGFLLNPFRFGGGGGGGGGGGEWYDTFTDTAGTALTAHTSDSGATYTASGAGTGVLAIDTGGTALRNTVAADPRRLFKASVVPASKDQTITAVYNINNFNKTHIALAARAVDVNNFYGLGFDSGIWTLYQFVSGTYTSLATWSDAANGTRTVVFSVTDAAKTVTINGTQRINYTATNALTAVGGYGLVAWYAEIGAGYGTIDSVEGVS